MSGHSKWSTIKHKKARTDSQRSKAWTKVVRELIIAARDGGGDPEFNATLRMAVQKAKACNMPKENIERAIKRGSGGADGINYETLTYEGYGAGGVAIIVDVLTDNKNRTVAEVRNIFSKNNGTLGEAGCVSWQFVRKGQISISAEGLNEDDVMMAALEAGADDVELVDDTFQITCEVPALFIVYKALEAAGFTLESSELTRIPQNTIEVDERTAARVMKLYGVLEDNDDVQNVYTNADFSEEILASLMD
ncbi:MAG: transcriptional regulator [Deltaproteobacteria bacterium CG2_30_63_29]|nr:MAG: transcriptional regulator [Deltaproteobacteria bacterium CG2_30_63_29]PJB46004.1 MAG: YebC/PmpR family DNA-binding transcriptional regulator [Deltaproteobacteria bacterium CG_4_9_14_3_um_filter_63_12]